ncbi:MAG: glycosyl transferase [Candidatus Taylorbacteria bacterium RIFCSPLOWO2_02_FULL_43_11]|uniref:Glycosyl transferase n=1 Tax=Candidatus Taylorbacteria bacterium RIFCSPHIGHO2_02_FULL_43_32b TaxID=1802306 RepID=A0A1G2MJ39_9BACT|nr:MAG: glycosyl transferase [Candidatus Taylorbacteria bacterium RIFCSPHIGHO2_01_FULL_43_47]OHA23935.1 MAG: glycosyl transferase [Candidatus Taylorbacteria bacterium RIFCSPHIGHO2_02_FULL_43_32b]OHA30999.1 MAG: glycosyl transferase [Candidatus Taylorbacteria bacterium RIFCSPLOWO2_01_FULL_43_44]OHA37207.1 MAG: glycosyl transferase [Candidatus Taylorbacteria bacterium RIFCSPLOWO2_02_FULL_43_11]
MKRLSVIIPVYNEEKTIETVINRTLSLSLPGIDKEIIVLDDGSKDQSPAIIKRFGGRIRSYFGEQNKGKGFAIRQGFKMSKGDFVIIQDADLEYDPSDFSGLLQPLLDGHADVVYGSRFISDRPHRVLFFWHSLGNKFLTALSNMFTNLNLTDMEVGYKAFNRVAIDKIKDELKSDRFTIEPEITARVARYHLRVYEVGISYRGRTYEEGKKINWKDGVAALFAIIRYRFFK